MAQDCETDVTSHPHSRKSKEVLCSVHFLLYIQSRMPDKGMVLPTVGRFALST